MQHACYQTTMPYMCFACPVVRIGLMPRQRGKQRSSATGAVMETAAAAITVSAAIALVGLENTVQNTARVKAARVSEEEGMAAAATAVAAIGMPVSRIKTMRQEWRTQAGMAVEVLCPQASATKLHVAWRRRCSATENLLRR